MSVACMRSGFGSWFGPNQPQLISNLQITRTVTPKHLSFWNLLPGVGGYSGFRVGQQINGVQRVYGTNVPWHGCLLAEGLCVCGDSTGFVVQPRGWERTGGAREGRRLTASSGAKEGEVSLAHLSHGTGHRERPLWPRGMVRPARGRPSPQGIRDKHTDTWAGTIPPARFLQKGPLLAHFPTIYPTPSDKAEAPSQTAAGECKT